MRTKFMKATRVYCDETGESHFEAINIKGEELNGGFISVKQNSSVVFRTIDGSKDIAWHTAPQSLYVILLEGQVQLELSDGDIRVFNMGDVLLMEDIEGKGHKSSSPDGKNRTILMVYLNK